MTNYIWEIAESYAQLVDVVKLRPWSKVAFEKEWPSRHYTPAEASAAWGRWPEMNIGAIAWPRYWVLDLDGAEAIEFFTDLCRTHGELRGVTEQTLTVRTPGRSGGLHLWWQCPDLQQGHELGQHLAGCSVAEIKHGPSRYTAVPPSIRLEGKYEFVPVVREPQPTPDWLLAYAVREVRQPTPRPGPGNLAELAAGDDVWAECARSLIAGTVESGVDSVLAAPEGGRNNAVYAAAHRLCEVGAFDHLGELVSAAVENGLGLEEAERAVESAARNYKGAQQ